ncbi:MAG: HAD family hydrolase [Deltaproteobacteria bacterium]
MTEAPAALFLDMFGTLVLMEPERLPHRLVGGEQRPATIEGVEQLLSTLRPVVEVESFVAALGSVSRQIAEEKLASGREIPSRVRFVRTLDSLGLQGPVASVAAEMSLRHMQSLARVTVCPPGRRSLLAALGQGYRLALVSNFDHAPTLRQLLEDSGLDGCFEAIVISEEVGWRKPGREIFLHTASLLGVAPARCLHVGDSYTADIEGAVGAGLRSIHVSALPAEPCLAEATIDDIADLPDCLAGLYPVRLPNV